MLTTAHFDYDTKQQQLIADVSDLRGHFIGKEIKIKSNHTNKIVTFKQVQHAKDKESDSLFWRYEPVTPCKIKNVILFND